MKVIITGCARSGTTLMVHLMRYFYSTEVILEDEKHPYDYQGLTDKVLVIKKPYQDVNNIQHFSIYELLKYGWKIVWMLRDGRDVISSKANGEYHCDFMRWIDSNTDYLNYWNNRAIHLVRYESLVKNPDAIMDGISDFIHQEFQADFHNFYNLMSSDKPMNSDIAPRPLDINSIGNHKNHPERVMQAMDHTDFVKLLKIFGYE